MPYPSVSFAKSVRSGATLPDFEDLEELRLWAAGEEQDDIVEVIASVQAWFADAGIVPLRTVYLLEDEE